MESKVNEPIYKQIALDIAGRIYNNDIKVGQKIHGRSTLASSYNVSPETVRKAVKLLEDMKVVSSSKGSGVTIISKDNAYNFINRFHSIESVTSLKHDIESLMEEKKAIEKNKEDREKENISENSNKQSNDLDKSQLKEEKEIEGKSKENATIIKKNKKYKKGVRS